jgi:hypothetical protein
MWEWEKEERIRDEMREKYAEIIAEKDAALAEKEAEIAKLKDLLKKEKASY